MDALTIRQPWWHWWLGDRVVYPEVIPVAGRLGLWEWTR